MAVTFQKLIVAQQFDYEQLLTTIEQLQSRGQYLQTTGNENDRQEGNDLIAKARQLQNTAGDLRQQIDDNIRQNNKP